MLVTDANKSLRRSLQNISAFLPHVHFFLNQMRHKALWKSKSALTKSDGLQDTYWNLVDPQNMGPSHYLAQIRGPFLLC